MSLLEPIIAARSCEDCQKWWYDDAADPKTGKMTWSTSIVREPQVAALAKSPQHKLELMEQTCRRPVDPKTGKAATPCDKCPKESPEKAHLHQLSHKNRRTVQFWKESRAMNFQNLNERMRADPILRHNFAICDELHRAADRKSSVDLLGHFLSVIK